MSTATFAISTSEGARRRSDSGSTTRYAGWAANPGATVAPALPATVTRLTRRGRLVVLFTLLALAFAVFTVLSGPADSTDDAHHAAAHTVVVGSGQTLWDIATRIAPDEDPRTVIADIVDLNALSDAGSIRIGEKLFVPAY